MNSGVSPTSMDQNIVEPLVGLSAESIGETLLITIGQMGLVDAANIPLIDASTDPEVLDPNSTVLAILEATDADDDFTEAPVAIGLVNEPTNDVLAVGLADPLTGDLFAVGILSDIATDTSFSSTPPLPTDTTAPIYLISEPSASSDLSIFVFSDFESDGVTILEPTIGVGGAAADNPATVASSGVVGPSLPGPSAMLTPDIMLL